MRIAALTLPVLMLLSGCMFGSADEDQYAQPNDLMATEIESRVQQIPYQHRDELLQNLLWLAQTGETTIPSVLRGLKNDNPKVRSSCAWVLGRLRDRRTIPALQAVVNDSNPTVRLEVARTLLALGDMDQAPILIDGLDSERKEVRYLCHEVLKTATGRDFGFDHLSDNEQQRHMAVLGWRQWWGEYSGDSFFARSYQQRFGLQPAAPMGETQGQGQEPKPAPQGQDPKPATQDPAGQKPATQTTPTTDPDDGVILVEPVPGTDPATKPATGSDPAKPGTTKPGTKPAAPGTTNPGTTKPGTNPDATTNPDGTKPDGTKPDATGTGTTKPETPAGTSRSGNGTDATPKPGTTNGTTPPPAGTTNGSTSGTTGGTGRTGN